VVRLKNNTCLISHTNRWPYILVYVVLVYLPLIGSRFISLFSWLSLHIPFTLPTAVADRFSEYCFRHAPDYSPPPSPIVRLDVFYEWILRCFTAQRRRNLNPIDTTIHPGPIFIYIYICVCVYIHLYNIVVYTTEIVRNRNCQHLYSASIPNG